MSEPNWDLTRNEIWLKQTILVVTPCLVPDKFIFKDLSKYRFFETREPELAVGLNFRLNSIDHTKHSHNRFHHNQSPVVVVSTVEVERSVACFESLPIHVVEVQVPNGGKLRTRFVLGRQFIVQSLPVPDNRIQTLINGSANATVRKFVKNTDFRNLYS